MAGELRKSADLCKQILDTDPTFAHGYHLMSSLFRATGNFDKALDFSKKAVHLAPNMPDFYVQQGQILFVLGRWEEAEQVFAKVHAICPNDITPLILWADSCARQEKFEQSELLFAKARSISDTVDIDEHEGLYLLAKGDMEKAEALFDKVIKQKPAYDWGYIHKGKLLLLQNRDTEAGAHFARALTYNPMAYEALYGVAIVNERQGDMTAALTFAAQAIKVNPMAFNCMALLGALLLRRQNFAGAQEVFSQALTLMPDQIYALHGLIAAVAGQNRLEEASHYIGERLKAKPGDATLGYMNAMLNGEPVPAPPAAYITARFDDYAQRPDEQLRSLLLYTHTQFAETIRACAATNGKTGLALLDVGCGTGPCAYALQSITAQRVGVDLSQKMLDLARGQHLYQELHALDMVEFMTGSERTFDIITAFDVLPYTGDVAPFFRAARNVLSAQGILALTLEVDSGANPYRLKPTGRYSHSLRHTVQTIQSEGYSIILQDSVKLYTDAGKPAPGAVMILKKLPVH